MDFQEARETIIESVSLFQLVQDLGIPSKRIGTNVCILCPNHNDKSYGSCIVFDRNIFCFACHTSMNAIDLVMKEKDCGFMDAMQFLSDLYGLQLDLTPDAVKVDPLVIPKAVLNVIGIHDTVAFKKLYEQDAKAAIASLETCLYHAKRQYYAAASQADIPDEARAIIRQRTEMLERAKQNLYHWKQEAGSRPLRLK